MAAKRCETTQSELRRNRGARFRRTVHAAHRAPNSRAASFLRDAAVHRADRKNPRARRRWESVALAAARIPCMTQRAPQCDPEVLKLGVPVLGICYGLQWITHTLGGEVSSARSAANMAAMKFDVANATASFCRIAAELRIWNNHGDHVYCKLPRDFASPAKQTTRFPPPKIHNAESTPCNFIRKCGTPIAARTSCAISFSKSATREPNWSGAAFIAETVESIRQKGGETTARSARSAAAWIPPWRRCSWTARSATDSRTFS